MATLNKSFILVDNTQGIYAGQQLALNWGQYIHNLTTEMAEDLTNPENDFYIDSFNKIIDTSNLEYKGVCYSITQSENGDVWAIHPDEIDLFDDILGDPFNA